MDTTPYRSLSNAAAPSAFRPIGHRAERSYKPVDVARPQPNHATPTRSKHGRRPWSRLFRARSPSPPVVLRPAPIRRMKTEDTGRFGDRSSDTPFRMLSSHQFERHSPERYSPERLVSLRPSVEQQRRGRRHSPERRAMPSPNGVVLTDRPNHPTFGTSSPTLGRAWAPRRQLSAFDSLPSLQARRAQTMDAPLSATVALAVAPDDDEDLIINCPARQCSRTRRPRFWRNPPHAPNCPRRIVKRLATEDEQWKAGYLAGVLASMETNGKRVDSSLKTDRVLLWDNAATTLGNEHSGAGKLTRMMSGRRRTGEDKSTRPTKMSTSSNLRRRWASSVRFLNNDSSDDVMSSVTRGSDSNDDR